MERPHPVLFARRKLGELRTTLYRLTRRNIPDGASTAETGNSIQHPVLKVMAEKATETTTFLNAYEADPTTDGRKRLSIDYFSSLADTLVDGEPYQLDPQDFVNIWTHVTQTFGKSELNRRNMMKAVVLAYGVQELNNPLWKQFPGDYIEATSDSLPAIVGTDPLGASEVRTRVETIRDSLVKTLTTTDPSEEQSEENLVKRKLLDDFGNAITPIVFALS